MNRFALMIAAAAMCCAPATADAQLTTVYYPAPVATTAYYAPAPHAVYYAPAPQTVYYAPVRRTVYYAAAPAVAVAPVVTTRYRPLVGGSVTRVRTRRFPVTYVAPAPTVVAYPAY